MSVTSTAVFFCSWPRCLSAAAGCTYTGVVATVAPPGRTRCRNGEVWTSPRRESPRLPLRSQRSGGTSSPKADGLYKSCWRIAAQQWATLDTGPGSVGASGAQRARCTLRWSRLRAASVKGGPVTRALPCSRALTRQPDDTGGSSRRKEKRKSLF